MASIFTFQEEPPRIHSPWSTPGNTTPRNQTQDGSVDRTSTDEITRLEPERQDGPCEYKLHLLLRPRRKFTYTTTTTVIPGSAHSRPLILDTGRTMSESLMPRPTNQPSSQTRQARLQQLTTQLLWRLQQSSPFHSSSNTNLVLPLLPEATPKLGVPERPATLLPGLEESQGALYEIGVADDGTLVGLVDDELDESLTNLRAMAASLGCVVDILRRVQVGKCEWFDFQNDVKDPQLRKSDLMVAEVLVHPDTRAVPEVLLSTANFESKTLNGVDHVVAAVKSIEAEQMRVTFVGSSTTGKSSLVGTLATSKLDNGRGKSRLSLLKHRHEIASGITSSVAQELVGYQNKSATASAVVNYATGDVSSWTDIHNLADRLVFLTDSPGLSRYAKSAFRALLSWNPQWTIFCVAADNSDENMDQAGATAPNAKSSSDDSSDSPVDLSFAYLSLCLRLKLPLVVVITKMDLATKPSLRTVLAKTLSMLKNAGRKPALLTSIVASTSTNALDTTDALPDLERPSKNEQDEVARLVATIIAERNAETVPIVMTSTVSGNGMAKLHTLLKTLPTVPASSATDAADHESSTRFTCLFSVDEVFSIPLSRVYSSPENEQQANLAGVVLCGYLRRGKVSIGDRLYVGPFMMDEASLDSASQQSKSQPANDVKRMAKFLTSTYAKSYQADDSMLYDKEQKHSFVVVRVVSLRNLRLPVISMHEGETGTIGVEPLNEATRSILQKARKGMVLADQDLSACRSFTATFPSSDFSQTSSAPLILGGHAIVYVNTIRAAARVISVSLATDSNRLMTEPSSPNDLFAFDSESDDEKSITRPQDDRQGKSFAESNINISFRFGSTVEWIDVGDQVLIVPTLTASGPVTGLVSAAVNTGLSGFIGSITELHY